MFDPHVGFMKDHALLSDSGHYSCEAIIDKDPEIFYLQVLLHTHVDTVEKPTINASVALIGGNAELDCSVSVAAGVIVTLDWVPPNLQLLGDSVEIRDFENSNSDSTYIPRVRVSQKYNISTLIIDEITEEDAGYYTCKAESRVGSTSKSTVLNTMHASPQSNKASFIWIVLFCIIVLLFAFIIIFLIRRVRKERAKRKQITNGLRNFEQGQIGSINPDLDLAEQADLLPYNKKFEFPHKKLKLD
ncbi:vascular endothelial growth factor receptor 1-like isoform X2 [Lycorma delicatula]